MKKQNKTQDKRNVKKLEEQTDRAGTARMVLRIKLEIDVSDPSDSLATVSISAQPSVLDQTHSWWFRKSGRYVPTK